MWSNPNSIAQLALGCFVLGPTRWREAPSRCDGCSASPKPWSTFWVVNQNPKLHNCLKNIDTSTQRRRWNLRAGRWARGQTGSCSHWLMKLVRIEVKVLLHFSVPPGCSCYSSRHYRAPPGNRLLSFCFLLLFVFFFFCVILHLVLLATRGLHLTTGSLVFLNFLLFLLLLSLFPPFAANTIIPSKDSLNLLLL